MQKLSFKEAKDAVKAIVGETQAMLEIGSVGGVTDQARRDNLLGLAFMALAEEVERLKAPAAKPAKAATAKPAPVATGDAPK
jgi:hypothetical protein